MGFGRFRDDWVLGRSYREVQRCLVAALSSEVVALAEGATREEHKASMVEQTRYFIVASAQW